jgi:predicted transcriptional regulator
MKTNIQLIRYCVDNGIERYLAVWHKLKSRHVNGRFYTHSINSIAKQTGLSRTAINKYLNFFLEQGWCKRENNTIRFISLDKMRKLNDINLTVNIELKGKTITEITNNIRYELLKEKQRQFNYCKELESHKINARNLAAYKKAMKILKGEKLPTHLTITLQKLTTIVNKSQSTIHRLIKTMGATIFEGVRVCLTYCANIELPKGFYFHKGKIYKKYANSYIF